MTPSTRRLQLRAIAMGHDLLMVFLSLPLAFWLRLDAFSASNMSTRSLLAQSLLLAGIAAGVFWLRPSRAMWRYCSTRDLLHILRSITYVSLFFVPALFAWTRLAGMPRSVFFIQWLLLAAMLMGPRIGYRLFREGYFHRPTAPELEDADRIPTLLAGSGDEAEHFIRGVHRDRAFRFRLVGLIESDPTRVGLEIHGVPVVGSLDEPLREISARLRKRGAAPRKLLVAGGRVDGSTTRRMLDEAERLGMSVARVAAPTELRRGTGARTEVSIQPIAVEDLLNRPQAELNHDQMRALTHGRRVLVTGAGGSIGSELVRQIAASGPSNLVLVEFGEHNLYQIDHEVARTWPTQARHPILCDVRDRDALNRVFTAFKPEIVFHAAALKHVPMVEYNPSQGVLTNVLGSRNVADLCCQHHVGTMVMISTDKAVNPANVMGATKRLAECYCQARDLQQAGRARRTRFVTVRFGNVLGSSGSVVPLFRRQLAEGGPLTVTHPEIVRYFMTIREAVQLVLQAGALPAEPGHDGKLFVLDMGEPVRIADLARQMIRLAGLVPDRDVAISYTGLRPGEKLYEELFYGAEALVPTDVAGIQRASQPVPELDMLRQGIDALIEAAKGGEDSDVRRRLAELVGGYDPIVDAADSPSKQRA